jgi:hypothetical protein
MHQATMAFSIQGATAGQAGPSKCAATPSSLIGKAVKSVGKAKQTVKGDDIIGVTITFTDGTQVTAVYLQSGMATTVKGGALLQTEANGCQYTLT